MNENTEENQKKNRKIWHFTFTLDEKHEKMTVKEILEAFATYNKCLKRKLGYIPFYTRKVERSGNGRLHLHVVYWNIPNKLTWDYKKDWKYGFLMPKWDKEMNVPMFITGNPEYMEHIADYFYDDSYDQSERSEVRRIVEHSQGLKKAVNSDS